MEIAVIFNLDSPASLSKRLRPFVKRVAISENSYYLLLGPALDVKDRTIESVEELYRLSRSGNITGLTFIHPTLSHDDVVSLLEELSRYVRSHDGSCEVRSLTLYTLYEFETYVNSLNQCILQVVPTLVDTSDRVEYAKTLARAVNGAKLFYQGLVVASESVDDVMFVASFDC